MSHFTGPSREELRNKGRKLRDSLPMFWRQEASMRICNALLAQQCIEKFSIFMVYCSFRSEVDTRQICNKLLQQKNTVAVPVALPENHDLQPVRFESVSTPLLPGFMGIPEPFVEKENLLAPEHIEVILLPGLYFDRHGNRLGYGGGYYDRFLLNKAPQAVRIGLAFSEQIINTLPSLPHDQKLDMLISEREILLWPGRLHS